MVPIRSKEINMKLRKYFLALSLLLINSWASAALKVVTTITDLGSITKEVGGNLVTVTSIAKGYQDPHFVEAKPSYLLNLRNADLFVEVGLELEVAWAPPLLINARNEKILPGNVGFLDVSQGCEILQKVSGTVDRSQGDVHPFGNPHYWLDPENGRMIARNIANKLAVLDPANAAIYKANLAAFETKLTDKEKTWDAMAKGLKSKKVVTYHNSWPNFAKRFGLDVVNYVEPKAGVPPSPTHIESLIKQIKDEHVSLLLIEPYFDSKMPEKIAKETGATLLIFPPSVGAEPDINNYFDLLDHNLKLLADNSKG